MSKHDSDMLPQHKVSTSSSARKVIPKRLEEELSQLPRYKLASSRDKGVSLSDVLDDSVERAMYDQILGPLINRRPSSGSLLTRSRPTSSSAASSSSSSSSSSNNTRFDTLPLSSMGANAIDTTFNASVLSRLSAVEGENKDLRRQLAEKVLKVDQLERENRQLTRQLDASSSTSNAKARELVLDLEEARQRGTDLECQIEEMEKFLADYGLVWVGNNSGSHEEQQQPVPTVSMGRTLGGAAPPPSSPGGAASLPPGVDFHAFSLKVQELNTLISSEPTQIKVEARRARLLHASEAVEHIPLTFYRNGLMIRRGPFRPNGSPNYDSFTRDILDGFFPSEFRSDYPDGVILELKDRHLEDYNEQSAAREQMSGSQLLRRLPKNVIRNGNVVEIRDEVDRLLQEGPSLAADDDTFSSGKSSSGGQLAGKTQTLGRGVIMLTTPASNSSPSMIAFVQVQVRWVDGSLLQAKMFQGDVVGDIREHIKRHFSTLGEPLGSGDFELRAAYPPRLLEDHMTLDEAGLAPTGVVHARRIATD